VASGIASSAGASRADENYTECMMEWGYDRACERRYYEERRAGRAVGASVGMITREIVRD
jgi:hypothetical protein